MREPRRDSAGFFWRFEWGKPSIRPGSADLDRLTFWRHEGPIGLRWRLDNGQKGRIGPVRKADILAAFTAVPEEVIAPRATSDDRLASDDDVERLAAPAASCHGTLRSSHTPS